MKNLRNLKTIIQSLLTIMLAVVWLIIVSGLTEKKKKKWEIY